MTLNQSQAEIRDNLRDFANVKGTTALLRHPDAKLNDHINRAIGSLHRRLRTAIPDQRILAETTITTEDGVTMYDLPETVDYLISVELIANSHRSWLTSFEMSERPSLISEDIPSVGIPFTYRLRGEQIELLPTPTGEYDVHLWFVPAAQQLATDGEDYDTISRLDDYIIAYAARFIAIKDKNWDLAAQCKALIEEIGPEIDALSRNRDRNSPPRIIDVYASDRWGRSRRRVR